MSAAGSTQAAAAAAQRERERGRMKEKSLHKKERLREVPVQGPSVQGLSSCRVKSPYRKKAGSSQQWSDLKRAHSFVFTPEQNNTRASVSAQQSSSGSGVLFRLTAMCKE